MYWLKVMPLSLHQGHRLRHDLAPVVVKVPEAAVELVQGWSSVWITTKLGRLGSRASRGRSRAGTAHPHRQKQCEKAERCRPGEDVAICSLMSAPETGQWRRSFGNGKPPGSAPAFCPGRTYAISTAGPVSDHLPVPAPVDTIGNLVRVELEGHRARARRLRNRCTCNGRRGSPCS